MNIKKLITVLLFLPCAVSAQTISGKITETSYVEGKKETMPLPSVRIYWQDGSGVTQSDLEGYFELTAPDSLPMNLIFKFVGKTTDTLLVNRLPLKNVKVDMVTNNLDGVVIKGGQKSSFVSIISPWNKEILSGAYLKTGACCNVSEVFENSASVDVNATDAVSGAKSIQFLGLDGVYAQIMIENVPFIRGLESQYGLNSMPGTWLNSIQITKGTGSITNGYESTTGQLNIEYHKADNDELDPIYLNAYGNNNGRFEGNFHFRKRLNETWSTLLMGHGMYLATKNDHNNDGFLDNPFVRHAGFNNRWRYLTKKVEGRIMIGMMDMNNQGGQVDYEPDKHKFGTEKYGLEVNSKQYYLTYKNAFLFPGLRFATLGLIGHVKWYDQDAYYGLNTYDGKQRHAYFNAIYEDILGNSFHKIRTGLSTVYDNMSETLNDSTFSREEIVPGIFAEYSFKDGMRRTFVVGGRGDYNMFYDELWFTPRVHMKYLLTEDLGLRLGGGRSYRTPNTISENLSLLASSRIVKVQEKISYEEAWNYGGSLTWDYKLLNKEGVIRIDAYRTEFTNQLVVDRDANAREINFYNLKSKSFSNVFQIDWSYEPNKNIVLNTSYKYTDVKLTIDGTLRQAPLVPQHRALFNIGLSDNKEFWQFDFTMNWFGSRRIPDLNENIGSFNLSNQSDDYFLINAQITRNFKRFEVYAGGENLLNFKQANAIVSAEDPFGTYFDATNQWGPVNGRVIYIGIRTKFR